MRSAALSKTEALEEHAGYMPVPGAHLYAMLHRAARPEARVLLIGPFASERHSAYHAWVRWARYLSRRGLEVLRYDHRGTGESTGEFEVSSFEQWSADAQRVATQLARQRPELPLLIHGMGLGAVLAGRCFSAGVGEVLLLWSPPANANQALRAILRRWAGIEQIYDSPANRKPASEYIRELESGASIEVHGYVWPSRLWRESFEFGIPEGMKDEGELRDERGRPMKVVTFGSSAQTVVMPYRRYDEGQDLSSLYGECYAWVTEALCLQAREADGRRNSRP